MTTKRVRPRQAAQFGQERVGGDVVCPGCGHGFVDRGVVEGCQGFFDEAKGGERVNTVLAEGEEGGVFFGLGELVVVLSWMS